MRAVATLRNAVVILCPIAILGAPGCAEAPDEEQIRSTEQADDASTPAVIDIRCSLAIADRDCPTRADPVVRGVPRALHVDGVRAAAVRLRRRARGEPARRRPRVAR